MTREKFKELMEGESQLSAYKGCNALLGLKIITKYLPEGGICGADHDIIFSATITEILEAGITEEDVIELRKLNWIIDETNTGLACYV